MSEFISKEPPQKFKMTTTKHMANKINVSLFNKFGARGEMPVLCSICGNVTTIDSSFSNKGRNLLCSDCLYKNFGNWKEAFDNYISK